MDKELIQRARNTNLAEYLLERGVPLLKNGARYRHKEHSSLVFTNNMYYWNSKSEYGNSIDYLINYYDMEFDAAVKELAGFSAEPIKENNNSTTNFSFGDIKINKNMSRAIAYLVKARGIDIKIIQRVLDNKLLFQEEKTNNIIFVMRDENNEIVGAELSGSLSDRRFKGVCKGSKYGYGFNIKFGEKPMYLLSFESAVDMLSFIEIEISKGKSLSDCLLVSMAGLKKNVIDKMISVYGKMQIVICVDNDSAGENFIEEIKNAYGYIKILKPDLAHKDWNEQLKNTANEISVLNRNVK